MLKNIIKDLLPESFRKRLIKLKTDIDRRKIAKLPLLNQNDFVDIITNRLQVQKGDLVMIHSSLDRLNLNFSSFDSLDILLDIVGEEGTLVFPTFPKLTSSKFLEEGHTFNIRKTPSYTGLLSELARRHKKAIRSLHPTKSVVAIGKLANEITSGHNLSPYPYEANSPFAKLGKMGGKIIGLGVKTTYLSAVHVVDDIEREIFPINPYLPKLFQAECIDYNGETIIVPTFAHDMKKMNFNLPKYFANEIPKSVCEDINFSGMNFFRADAAKMLEVMTEKARKGVTIYSY